MLAQLGAVTFELRPLNIHETSRSSSATFAEKPVIGRRPPLEAVGEGAQTFSLSGRIFPEKLGGLMNLELLNQQMAAQIPVPYVRGDGVPMGWVVIESVTEKGAHLDQTGVGRVIDFEVSLKRSDPPSFGQIYSILSGMLS